MKSTHNYLLSVITSSLLCSVCACNNVNSTAPKSAGDSTSAKINTSTNTGDTITTIVEGHQIQIVKNDPNTLLIDGKSAKVASYSATEGNIPDSLKKGTTTTSIVNGKKVTVYNYSSCTQGGDTLKAKNTSIH